MTDLTQLSDAELLAMYKQPSQPDVAGMVTAEAQRQGVDPQLALRVARQESGFRAGARSPKGALGPMQLMPATARDLGVDPNDPAQNVQGGVAYLKKQLDTFGDPRLALAAYNAGPGAVRKYGGVPPYAETQNYVANTAPASDLSSIPDDQLMAMYQGGGDAPQEAAPAASPAAATPAPSVINAETGKPYNPAQQAAYAQLIQSGQLDPRSKPGSAAFPRGLASARDVPKAGEWYVDLDGALKQAPSVLSDAASGFAQPFRNLAHDVAQDYRDKTAQATAPLPDLGTAVSNSIHGLSGVARIAGDTLGLTGAPLQAAVRPAARAINRLPMRPYTQDTPFSAPRPMGGDEAQAALEGALNTALSAAAPAKLNMADALLASKAATPVRGANLRQQLQSIAPQMPVSVKAAPPSLDELRAAKTSAYKRAEASGVQIPPTDAQKLASSVAQIVEDKGGKDLYPTASLMAKRLQNLAQKGLTPTQLDDFRGQVYEQLMSDGGKEANIGKAIRSQIDSTLASEPAWADARAANTRYEKAREITDRLGSADLRASSTYSGGNLNNTIRQNLRPLIDPKSPQQLRNLTPDEAAALTRAVKGSPTQNATRYASKILTNKFLQAGVAWPTHGVGPAVMEAAGLGLRKLGEGQTQANVQALLDLIANGGKAAKPAPVLTVPRLVGAGVVAAPLLPKQAPRKRKAQNG